MHKLGSKPTTNWERIETPVITAGVEGAAYAFMWKDTDFITIHNADMAQIDVIRGVAPIVNGNWGVASDALALAGYSAGLSPWIPTGDNGGPGYGASYRVEIGTGSVLAAKERTAANWQPYGNFEWYAEVDGCALTVAEPRTGQFFWSVSRDEEIIEQGGPVPSLGQAQAEAEQAHYEWT